MFSSTPQTPNRSIVPEFSKFPEEGAIIGRLLAGYGNLGASAIWNEMIRLRIEGIIHG